MSQAGRPTVLVLGGGLAGMSAAEEMAKLLSEHECEVTLVVRCNFLLFTPMLTEVAGGQLDPRHVARSVRHIVPRVRFVQGRVWSGRGRELP